MPVQVSVDHPHDNDVTLSPKYLAASSGTVEIRGKGNRIYIEDPLFANSARFFLANGATVIVRMDSNLNDLQVHALAPGATIEIGPWCSFSSGVLITAHEPSRIEIGAFCLFGSDCRIASSDVHKVLDLTTQERLNPPGDILLGEHVWAAPGVTILRNAVVGRDSVIGAGSLVRDVFPPNVSLAGLPARIVRTGVTWAF